jgi:hypothetical protein
VVAWKNINVVLDEELVRSVRQQAVEAVGKSDAEIVEDVLSAYLADRGALGASGTVGPLQAGETDRLGLEEVHVVRRIGGGGPT